MIFTRWLLRKPMNKYINYVEDEIGSSPMYSNDRDKSINMIKHCLEN